MTDFNLFLREMRRRAILSRSSNADVLGRLGMPSKDAVFEVIEPCAVDARFHEQHCGHHRAHARLAVDEDVTFSREFSHGFDDVRMRHEEAAAVSGHAGVLLRGANVEDEGSPTVRPLLEELRGGDLVEHHAGRCRIRLIKVAPHPACGIGLPDSAGA